MKSPVYLKACKRCYGTLSLERDHYGEYLVCIQCGAHSYPTAEAAVALEKQPVKVAVA